jgi:hypothetical protein
VKVIEAGDGSRHPIESKYLEPEVHSLMEIDSVSIDPKRLKRQILLVSELKSKLKGTHVLKYIEWGERETFDDPDGKAVPERSTVAARQSDERQWYDLTIDRRGQIFWPKSQQYRHIIAVNYHNVICNCNLYDIFLEDLFNQDAYGAVLNSSLVVLMKHLYGRPMGREGNLKTEVIDVNLMPVPNPTKASERVKEKLIEALHKMSKRPISPMLEERFAEIKRYVQVKELEDSSVELPYELRQEDRRELDDAVFELIGVQDRNERVRLIERLYREVALFNRRVRILELQAIENKIKTGRKTSTSPQTIAQEIWDSLVADSSSSPSKIPDDFLPAGVVSDTITLPDDGKPRVIDEGFEGIKLKVGQTSIAMRHPPQAKLAQLLVQHHIAGRVTLPTERKECDRMREALSEYLDEWQKKLAEFAGERTSDEELAQKIEKHLWRLFFDQATSR